MAVQIFTSECSETIPEKRQLAQLVQKVLRAEKQKGDVNLVFCENKQVRILNRKYRKLDKVTDVLSFNYDEEDILGEIYIAGTQALTQSKRYKHSFLNELRRLVVHGALHLSGYDHIISKERKIMRAKEEHYLTSGK